MESFVSGGAVPESACKYLAEQLSKPSPLGVGEQHANEIFFPETGVTLKPYLDFPGKNQAVVIIDISLSQNGKTWTEISVGVGQSPELAIDLALKSLNFSLFTVLGRMLQPIATPASINKGGVFSRFFKSFTMDSKEQDTTNQSDDTCSVNFVGKKHNYKVWISNIVTMGQAPMVDNPDFYWNLLKEQISERLGDQPLTIVKLYVSLSGGTPICECRINDELIEGPKALLNSLVEKWPKVPFASHKQYILLEQEVTTLQPYPYHSFSAQKDLKQRLKEAVTWWYQNRDKDVDEEKMLSQILGDPVTASSFGMVAEICAEHAFSDMTHSETISFYQPDGSTLTFYKVQLQDYIYLKWAIMELIQEQAWAEETQNIFKALVLSSSTAAALNSMYNAAEQKGEDPSEITASHLLFMISPSWQPR